MKMYRFAIAAALACAMTPAAVSVSSPAFAAGTRLSCGADGATDFSTDARFETRGSRRKFDASFESAPGLGFSVGQRLAVAVGGVAVGQMTLRRDVTNGDVIGDLTFENVFPVSFPKLAAGTSVTVGSLGCALR